MQAHPAPWGGHTGAGPPTLQAQPGSLLLYFHSACNWVGNLGWCLEFYGKGNEVSLRFLTLSWEVLHLGLNEDAHGF